METRKTSVQITQELLALATTRVERQTSKKHTEQTVNNPENDPLVHALMNELSLYGDGVSGSVEKTDPYYTSENASDDQFKSAVSRLREEAGEIPESLQKIFDSLT